MGREPAAQPGPLPAGPGQEMLLPEARHAAASARTSTTIPIAEKNGQIEDYLYVEDAAGIVACVQMGTIEFHGWGSSVADVEKPDRLVFDLDPDEGLGFDEVKRAARDLHRHLADMGLQTFPMLTGGKGAPRRRAADARGGMAGGQGFRPALRHRARHGRARALHRQPRQGEAQGPDLPRLSAQPARRDRDPALFAPAPAKARRSRRRSAGTSSTR